jgi:hypothetical protein
MPTVRIGTGNMEGRRGPAQTAVLAGQDCDVWLLTEVNHRLELPDGRLKVRVHRGVVVQGRRAP